MSLQNELSLDEMPYEKCKALGPAVLSDAELLSVFIRTGSGRLSCIEIARKLLGENKDGKALLGLLNLSIPELLKYEGIGDVRAVQLVCMMELSKRIWRMNRNSVTCFLDPKTVSDYFMEEMRHKKHEVTKVLFLNSKGALLKEADISIGTVNASLVSPREIFINALKYEAVNIILMHNHPSGDPTPSENDISATVRVMKAGDMLGIKLLDHIIIGDGCYISLSEAGYVT